AVGAPPMWKVIISPNPAIPAMGMAATPPPAGPERIVLTGSRAAVSAEIEPPDDCMIRNWFASRLASLRESPPVNSFRYRLTSGARYALMTTVEVLSYSRLSGRIRLEIEIGTPNYPTPSAPPC